MKKTPHSSVRSNLVRIAKIHVVIGIFLVIQIMVYDAGKLITPEAVLKRWIVTSIFVLAALIVWYLARLNNSAVVLRNLTWLLIAADILLASFSVYTQRGMASRAVLLFILPILTAAVLQRKGPIYLVSALSVIAYSVTAIAYFVLNFNEGYKLELYGEISFYSAMLLAVGWLTWALVRKNR